jgi:anthranilate synthase component 1
MKFYPDKKEFIALAKGANLIPVYAEIMADLDTPISAFSRIDSGGYSFLLESVEGGERLARYSFLGSAPSMVFSSKGRDIAITENGRARRYRSADPIAELKGLMSSYRCVGVKGLPRFFGGFVGYIGYDMVRFIEDLPDTKEDDLGVPDSVFMLTDTLLIFDHVDHKIKIVSNAHVKGSAGRAYCEAVRKIEALARKLRSAPGPDRGTARRAARGAGAAPSSNMTRGRFERMVRAAKQYIRKGDIIQVVLSQRLKVPVRTEPLAIYRALRSVNPSPYMYYLKLKDFALVGSSPEIMVRCEDGFVEVRPIAGTRGRGASEAEDARLTGDLLRDPKERAEHIMLVDLGRNDIGRVCDFRTVKVSDLMTIEKYSHVMHMVTDVTGRLRKGADAFDVMRAAFPAGTVTGAPKVRAMEIIDELESARRGTYAGCVGYFSFSGNLDCCITIRTVLIKGRTAYIQAGAGIVADSVPGREYKETLKKAGAMLKAIELAHRGPE